MAKHSINIKDWVPVEKGFQRELLGPDVKGRIHQAIVNTLISAQKNYLDNLPTTEAPYMPFITGNLHDSIASVISEGGRILNASYTEPVAITTSEVTGQDVFLPAKKFPTRVKLQWGRGVIGSKEAERAVRKMQGKYPSKIAATMLIAVPYAETPNEKGPHAGYIDVLGYKYAQSMAPAFRAAQSLGLWRWKGGFNLPQKYIESIINSEIK